MCTLPSAPPVTSMVNGSVKFTPLQPGPEGCSVTLSVVFPLAALSDRTFAYSGPWQLMMCKLGGVLGSYTNPITAPIALPARSSKTAAWNCTQTPLLVHVCPAT